MNQEVKQNIQLPEGLIAIVIENVNKIKEVQASVQILNQKIADVMTGFCLSQNLNLAQDLITFSDDYTSINVSEVAQENITKTEEPIKQTSKVKKIGSYN